MELRSIAFEHDGQAPVEFTRDGADASPPLAWAGTPEAAQSLALIVDNPDAPAPAAPGMTWVHGVLYNLPSPDGGLPQACTTASLPVGAAEGLNDLQHTAYGGPCPPVGRHRYSHGPYALDSVLPDMVHPTKAALETALEGHVLAIAELVGTYQR